MSQQQPLQNHQENVQLKQIHNIHQQENQNASLIDALKEAPNYFVQKYNEKMKIQNPAKPVRAGGVYVPPHRLRAMQEQLMKTDTGGIQHQRMMWQLLRKSINGIVNKVNISNIQNIVIELFNQNILRGKGLLSKSIIKAQMASPNFTHVYAALISVINTKLPEIGNLILKRVMIQFKRAFQRNNKIVCIATSKMIAHLINQRVLGQYAGLQLLFILLNQPSQSSVQIACDFMIEAGQMLTQITPAGANVIFQRFKTLLHQGQINQKAQYSIQSLFAIRKTGFKEHPGVIPELDLVQGEDQLIHNMDFQQQLVGQQGINVFKFDAFYQKTQQQWQSIKLQILGQQNIINLKQMHNYQQQMDQQQVMQQKIQDLTQQDLINLRRTIYLIIQSTVNFQQCAHKLLKMNIAKGYQHQLVDMIIQCCMMERIYQTFFGLLAQRFCTIDDLYKELFIKAFINHYNAIFKLEVNKLRNLARLFGHLLYRFAIDWTIFQVIVLKPQTTTAAGRMFLKILFKQIAQNLGMQRTIAEFNKQQMRQNYEGLFPIDHPNNLRFSINYFTSIGLGPLTENMREILQMQQQIIMSRKQKQQEEKIQLQLQEEEQMLRLMEAQQQEKIKVFNQKQKQRKLQNQVAQRLIQQRKKIQNQRKPQRKRKQSSSHSSSSSSSSSSDSSSSSRSNQAPNPKRKRQKSPQRRSYQQKKRRQISSDEQRRYRNRRYNDLRLKQRQRSRQKIKVKKEEKTLRKKSRSPSPSQFKQRKNKQNVQNQRLKLEQNKSHTKKQNPLQKVNKDVQKISKDVQKKRKYQSDEQSSGISSFSSQKSESGQVGKSKKQFKSKKGELKEQKSNSSSYSSSSSSSGSSVDTKQLNRRRQKRDQRK